VRGFVYAAVRRTVVPVAANIVILLEYVARNALLFQIFPEVNPDDPAPMMQ
jgi:hypothetical protein